MPSHMQDASCHPLLCRMKVNIKSNALNEANNAHQYAQVLQHMNANDPSQRAIKSLLTLVNTRLPARVLGPVLRYSAYMDTSEDLTRLEEASRIVKRFRCKGIDLDQHSWCGPFGESALHIAASAVRDIEAESSSVPEREDMQLAMDTLRSMGMRVDAQDDEGETPLHWAAFAGKVCLMITAWCCLVHPLR